MKQLLLIDSRVHAQPYIDCRKPSVDYIIFDYYKDTFNLLCDKIESNKYNQIGLVQHANFTSGFNILRKETVGTNSDLPPYPTFIPLLEFITKLKLKGVQTFDFLGCGLYDPIKTPAIFTYLEGASGVDLRASTNLTGSAPGDWIMESDNINIKSIYWTDEIDQYKGTLNAISNFPVNTNNTIKDINGNIIFLNKDIYGNPLNPTINSTGAQIKQIPSSVIAWGALDVGGDTTIPNDINANLTSDIVAVYSIECAFTALKTDGSVVYWGSKHYLCSSVILPPSNDNFVAIYSSEMAFVGLRANGTVAAWGGNIGGDISSVNQELNTGYPIVNIYTTGAAFAALKSNGTVVVWGAAWRGGMSAGVLETSVNVGSPVVAIYATQRAWAALKANGTVVSWGAFNSGSVGIIPGSENITNVKVIYSNYYSFAALKTDNTVVAWGEPNTGNTIPGTINVTNVKTIYSTSAAFAALKNNGSVVVWGREDYGGTFSNGTIDVSNQVTNIKTIYSNSVAFVALKTDGTVVTWGDPSYGGLIPDGLDVSNVVAIYSTDGAFAALTNSGSVVAWGNEDVGGLIPQNLDVTNVATIFSNINTFVALKNDKTLVAWGDPFTGGITSQQMFYSNNWNNTGAEPFDTSNSVTVYSSLGAFTVLKSINAPTPTGPNNGGGGSGGGGGGSGGGGSSGSGGGSGSGSTDHFFVNDSFTISQTANIFSNNLPLPYTSDYDYILDININGVWESMNNLFEDRRFMTEPQHADSNVYDFVRLNVNRENLANLLSTSDVVSISSDKNTIIVDHTSVYGTLDARNTQLVGFRFLEIVATKVFGHAKTKIAIENSDEYYANDYVDANTAVNSLIGQIAKGIFNSVINKKYEIMNEYIKTDRIEDNAENAVLTNVNDYPRPFMEYNFNDTVWEFPIVFHTDLATTGDDTINELNNGPDVGGARLANGSVDVPVLLRFSA